MNLAVAPAEVSQRIKEKERVVDAFCRCRFGQGSGGDPEAMPARLGCDEIEALSQMPGLFTQPFARKTRTPHFRQNRQQTPSSGGFSKQTRDADGIRRWITATNIELQTTKSKAIGQGLNVCFHGVFYSTSDFKADKASKSVISARKGDTEM